MTWASQSGSSVKLNDGLSESLLFVLEYKTG